MSDLSDSYWSSRYATANIGWDLNEVSPPLKAYFDQLSNKSLRILIPGCGNAYEAEYLLSKNFENITLIDISEILINSIKIKYSKYIESSKLLVMHADFFELKDSYDLIVEQTFFCAITPSLRSDYVKKMSELLRPNGKLVGVLFNREFPDGPPFGGSQIEYKSYFEPYFKLETFEECYNSVKPRQGSELFVILRKK